MGGVSKISLKTFRGRLQIREIRENKDPRNISAIRYANDAVRIGLHWPTVATRILMRKLTFLSKLLSNTEDNMNSRIFTTMAMDDVYSITIVQQCIMLKALLSMNITIQCLQCPSESVAIIRSSKKLLLGKDYDLLLSSALTHPSVEPIARITSVVLWKRI